ncbi:unnamed protein product [Porites evermanni]|uniref:G-protein coupled receptors family 1 profile domain-containing protein n=1 Tax=Porites evermanni TaxID=104178 RepID=A0ABN8MLJ0_9CNID|nr:unnamed protein product [Porites evermanni]
MAVLEICLIASGVLIFAAANIMAIKHYVSASSFNKSSSSVTLVGFSATPVSYQAKGIALSSALVFEGVLIFGANLLAIFLFVLEKKLRKKSLFLVINMSLADTMLGAVSLPFFLDSTLAHASLFSAVSISCERFYAIFWPMKHKVSSKRAYHIAICIVWTSAVIVSVIFALPFYLLTQKQIAFFIWIPFPIISLFLVCCCNFGIWRKFQKINIRSQEHNRALQNQRLTKTLVFVSAMAVLTWLPLIIFNVAFVQDSTPTQQWYLANGIINLFNFSNSILNPVVYALRIPEMRQSLFSCCSRRREAVMNREDIELERKRRGEINVNVAAVLSPVIQTRKLPTYPSQPEQTFEQNSMDTKL